MSWQLSHYCRVSNQLRSESCSPSEHKYLRDGLNVRRPLVQLPYTTADNVLQPQEMKMLAVHSYERILRMGEEDDLYVYAPLPLAGVKILIPLLP